MSMVRSPSPSTTSSSRVVLEPLPRLSPRPSSPRATSISTAEMSPRGSSPRSTSPKMSPRGSTSPKTYPRDSAAVVSAYNPRTDPSPSTPKVYPRTPSNPSRKKVTYSPLDEEEEYSPPPRAPTSAKVYSPPPRAPTSAKVYSPPPRAPTSAKVYSPPYNPSRKTVVYSPPPRSPTYSSDEESGSSGMSNASGMSLSYRSKVRVKRAYIRFVNVLDHSIKILVRDNPIVDNLPPYERVGYLYTTIVDETMLDEENRTGTPIVVEHSEGSEHTSDVSYPNFEENGHYTIIFSQQDDNILITFLKDMSYEKISGKANIRFINTADINDSVTLVANNLSSSLRSTKKEGYAQHGYSDIDVVGKAVLDLHVYSDSQVKLYGPAPMAVREGDYYDVLFVGRNNQTFVVGYQTNTSVIVHTM